MRTETVEINYYQFSELTLEAQKKAIEKLRDINVDYGWSNDEVEFFTGELESFGFMDSTISYSGFCSQGDGLSFTCMWIDLSKMWEHLTIPEHYQHHKKLFSEIFAGSIDRNSSQRYSHEKTVSLEFGYNDYRACISPRRPRLNHVLDYVRSVIDAFRVDLCRKYYRSLERQYDYLTSDDGVKETILCNEYEFDQNGNLI